MIIDSSALLAILLQEADARLYAEAIEAAPRRYCSAVSYVETAMVLTARKGDAAELALDALLRKSSILITPFDTAQAAFARDAFTAFGKGRHKASLNFGDCCSYGLAKAKREPLLFKGHDFTHTDIVPAL